MAKYFSAYTITYFSTFSRSHLLVLIMLATIIFVLYYLRNFLKQSVLKDKIRIAIALLLLLSEVFLQVWRIKNGVWFLQISLPLHLCSILVILCPIMLLTKKYPLYEILFFWGIGGTAQAILTPDLYYGFPHFIFFQYFTSHSLIVIACLWMTFIEKFRPTFKSIGKTFIAINIYAAFIFIINLALGSNYLYLMKKPGQPSIIDFLLPWPWYLLQLEVIIIIICLLCYLPFILADKYKKRLRTN